MISKVMSLVCSDPCWNGKTSEKELAKGTDKSPFSEYLQEGSRFCNASSISVCESSHANCLDHLFLNLHICHVARPWNSSLFLCQSLLKSFSAFHVLEEACRCPSYQFSLQCLLCTCHASGEVFWPVSSCLMQSHVMCGGFSLWISESNTLWISHQHLLHEMNQWGPKHRRKTKLQ